MGRWDKFFKLLKRGIEPPSDERFLENRDSKLKFRLFVPELTPEKKREMIDKLAERIKRMKLEAPAIIILEMFRPASSILSQIYGLYAAPFMELFGIRGYDYALLFSDEKNVKDLINKIKEK